ncbi:MAG: hypothetical protein II875_08185 [Clostridia bacterium]|nr:hypothetical protein [Clostridia bacterium]
MTKNEDKALKKQRRGYIRQQLRLHPPFGGEMILYGSIIILLWALGELNASYTFIVAWFKTDQRIIQEGYITFREYFFNILLKTPEAVQAIKQLVILCLSVVMGLTGIFFRKRKISLLMLVTAVVIATYEVADPFWMRLTDYTRYVKLGGCALLFIGSVCKIATWAVRRQVAKEQFESTHKSKNISARDGRRDKTLIPERVQTRGK